MIKILAAINDFCEQALSLTFVEFFPLTLCILVIALLFFVVFLVCTFAYG